MAMFKKVSDFFTTTAGRAMNKSTMLATTYGMAEMIYADGVVDDDELAQAWKIFDRNPKLAVFGADATKSLSSCLAMWKDDKMHARLETGRAIDAWLKGASKEDREDFLVSMLGLMEADDKRDDAEMAVAKKYAEKVGLKLEEYLQ